MNRFWEWKWWGNNGCSRLKFGGKVFGSRIIEMEKVDDLTGKLRRVDIIEKVVLGVK